MAAESAGCEVAFKEWAVVCAALAAGRQTLIVRKGGIDEGREGFRVEHARFWLFPTQFHQTTAELRAGFSDLVSEPATPGHVSLRLLAEVQKTYWLREERTLERLEPLQGLRSELLTQRFHYRTPGLFVIVARIYQRAAPHVIADDDAFAGCRSWVPLGQSLATDQLRPVLDDATFAARLGEIEKQLG